MKTSVRISSLGNRNAHGLTDRLDRKIYIYKTLDMNTCCSIPANYVVLNHTVSIICIFPKQKFHYSGNCIIMLGYMFRQSSMLSLCFKISKIVIYLITIYKNTHNIKINCY
jgi:hypothetical protein